MSGNKNPGKIKGLPITLDYIHDLAGKHELAEILAAVSTKMDVLLLKERSPVSRNIILTTLKVVRKCSISIDATINFSRGKDNRR